jgi:hypothetical protein
MGAVKGEKKYKVDAKIEATHQAIKDPPLPPLILLLGRLVDPGLPAVNHCAPLQGLFTAGNPRSKSAQKLK